MAGSPDGSRSPLAATVSALLLVATMPVLGVLAVISALAFFPLAALAALSLLVFFQMGYDPLVGAMWVRIWTGIWAVVAAGLAIANAIAALEAMNDPGARRLIMLAVTSVAIVVTCPFIWFPLFS